MVSRLGSWFPVLPPCASVVKLNYGCTQRGGCIVGVVGGPVGKGLAFEACSALRVLVTQRTIRLYHYEPKWHSMEEGAPNLHPKQSDAL